MNPQSSQTSSKIKLVISDFHLSRGKWLKDGRRNPLEDFHQDEKFKELLEHYSTGAYADADVELVVNGDFFDPLAVIPLPEKGSKFKPLEFPLEVQEDAAVRKFKTILEGHPASLGALQSFLARGKRVVFRWGNHDAGLLWPKVQELLRQELHAPRPEQIEFQMKPYIFDRICIDHGHQYEIIHQFDEGRMFIERDTSEGRKTIQNLPFGSFFVLDFLNRVKLKRSYINQIYPFGTYLRVSFFVQPIDWFVYGVQALWFFIKMRFVTHPMRFARFKKTLMILGEIVHRPPLEGIAEKLLTGPGHENLPFDTLIMGHNHQATIRIFQGNKQYINTGTWTPITSLDMATLGHRILRTYALIEYFDGKPRASLKVWNGKPNVADDFA